MLKKLLKTFGLFAMCITMMTAVPMVAYADENKTEYQTSTSMIVRVEHSVCRVYAGWPELSQRQNRCFVSRAVDAGKRLLQFISSKAEGRDLFYQNTITVEKLSKLY